MKGKNNILAVIMTMMMVLSLLPVNVSAAEPVALDGKLKIKGTAAVESTLSAEFKEVKPEGLTEDSVSYAWYLKTTEDETKEQAGETPELKELGKEKTYKVTADDIGSKIVLEVTGLADKGFSGTLKAVTDTVTEKQAEVSAVPEETETQSPEESTEQTEDSQESEAAAESESTDLPETTEDQSTDTPAAAEDQSTDTPAAAEDQAADIPAATEGQTTDIPEPAPDQSADAQGTDTEEAGSTSVEGIPAATEDGTYNTTEDNTAVTENNQAAGTENSDQAAVYYQAEAYVENTTDNVMDFGTISAGQEESTEGKFVTVINTGTGTLNFTGISPEHFAVQDITSPLEPGQSIQLWVSPRSGIESGSYEDTITYTSEEGAEASFKAKITVEESGSDPEVTEVPVVTETPEIPDQTGEEAVTFKASPESLTFPDVASQQITVSNTSQDKVTVNAASEKGYVTLNQTSAEIEGNDTAVFEIAPSAELNKETQYDDNIIFTDADNGENTVTVPVSVKIASGILTVNDTDQNINFGEVVEEYPEAPQARTVTVKNTGSVDLTGVTVTSAEGTFKYFAVSLDKDTIPAGGEATLTIQPLTGLSSKSDGSAYEEAFTVKDAAETTSIGIKASFTVKAASHDLSVKPEEGLSFASAKKGYGAVSPQTFTVTNTGNVTETLTQPSGSYFQVSTLDSAKLTLAPGETAEFSVSPVTGLDVGDYSESIKIVSTGVSKEIKASFQVVKGTSTLTKIQQPAEIKDLKNGTKKEASALKLPSTVVIETTGGNMNASVTWDLKNCTYNASSTEAQSFTVNGTVTLPAGVDNDNKISLTVSVKVNVKAYSAKQASADNNKITGIEYNGVYTTQSKISFTAVGAGMDNGSPRKGDTRYVPLNWTVINTNGWSAAPYTASFGLAKSGSYTLKVTFRQQQYNGKTWADTDQYDTKQVPFSVTKAKVTAPGLDITPAASQRNAVKTGDNTPILPFVIILIIAVAAISGVIVYKKKRK